MIVKLAEPTGVSMPLVVGVIGMTREPIFDFVDQSV
jgi:hypothetical protein